jgi:hypothetical protein
MYTTLTSPDYSGSMQLGDTEVQSMPCTINSSPASASQYDSSAMEVLRDELKKPGGDVIAFTIHQTNL